MEKNLQNAILYYEQIFVEACSRATFVPLNSHATVGMLWTPFHENLQMPECTPCTYTNTSLPTLRSELPWATFSLALSQFCFSSRPSFNFQIVSVPTKPRDPPAESAALQQQKTQDTICLCEILKEQMQPEVGREQGSRQDEAQFSWWPWRPF